MLNKTDRVDAAALGRLREAVASTGSGAAVISASYGWIDPGLLFDPLLRPDGDDQARQLTFEDLLLEAETDRHGHPHTSYESVAFTADEPMNPRMFMTFLDSRPEGLYRIKGFADFGPGDRSNRYTLHAVGRFLRFVPQPWTREEPRLTQLVLIGSGPDAEALHQQLSDCRDPDPEGDQQAHERAMWGVLRYVQQHEQQDEQQYDQQPDGSDA